MAKKKVLFITPVLPSLNGRGRNFRAYQWIWRLQKEYRVSVLCTSVYGASEIEDDSGIEKLDCKIYKSSHTYSTFQRIRNLATFKPSTWNEAGDFIEKEANTQQIPKPDLILCFRIQNASTALYLSRHWRTPEIWLDIDEVDSNVKYRISDHMRSEGYYLKAMKERMEAALYSFMEKKFVSEFDTVFTSTVEEEKKLEELNIAGETDVFSNMLPVINDDKCVEPGHFPFTFMFVGDSNYFPNLDAINFLLYEIIPGLDKVTEIPFRFIIIGGFVGNRQHHQIKKYDCITYYQDINDLKSIYHQANAVIVPLRAGGGSSLKFLEALRFKKPVVSTPIGARGFNVDNGVQALIGESSKEIIKHCQTLMNDAELARKLSEKGHKWFMNNHSFDVKEGVEDLKSSMIFAK